ncbi:MAG: hypothetical protein ACRBBJ_04190 [Rhodomicrobiaceae bacterium]
MSIYKNIMIFLMLFLLTSPVMAKQTVVKKKSSLSEIGVQGISNLQQVTAGYGTKICKDKIKTKQDITKIAWSKIRQNCGKFTFGMIKNFTDDPSVIYSLCIFSALEVCQKNVGIKSPCTTVETCRTELGVPRKGE